MVRSPHCHFQVLLAVSMPLVLSACFGRVHYLDAKGEGESKVDPRSGAGGQVNSGGTVGSFEPAPTGGATNPQNASGGSENSGTGGSRPNDTEAQCDKDCCPDSLRQITFSTLGGALNGDASSPYFSGDGTTVVFSSRATNLIDGAVSAYPEVYAYSLSDHRMERISQASNGATNDGASAANGISSDGRFVLMTSRSSRFAPLDNNDANDVFLVDRNTSTITLVSASHEDASVTANGSSFGRDLSPDGRFVVYSSAASDLTPHDDNASWDVFIWDRLTNTTELISMGPGDQQRNPVQGPHAHVSPDGRFVSFHSSSSELSPGQENGKFDIFLRDRQQGTTERVSWALSGAEGDGNTYVLGMSDDARLFASYSDAENLVSNDTNGLSDVFLFDRELKTTERINLGPNGQQAIEPSNSVMLSADGRYLSFVSASPNLTSETTIQYDSSYVYDALRSKLILLSKNKSNESGNGHSDVAHFSESGRCFVFASRASNLTPESTADTVRDLFVGRHPEQY